MNPNSKTISDSFILGCWQLDDRSWKGISEVDLARAIDTYLAWGITCFDTADIYGKSERILGQHLRGRDDCKIFTKFVFFEAPASAQHVRYKVESALKNLNRERLDLVQVHWHNAQSDFAETFETLQEFLEDGKIKQLGVTNFNTLMLERALNFAPIKTHQVQYNLIDRRVENSMLPLCLQQNITILPYGPLAGGFLSDKFKGVKNPPAEGQHARGFYYSQMIRFHGGWEPVQEMLSVVGTVGKKYKLDIAQVALNWLKNQPGVGAIICGLTQNRNQIQKNMEALNTTISAVDLKLLSDRSKALFLQDGDIYSYERR